MSLFEVVFAMTRSTKETWKDVTGNMNIRAEETGKEPKYKATAAELLKACREWYRDPGNEKAYSDWAKNGRNKKDR